MGGLNPLCADVLVVGGGPAGLVAGIAARLKGLDVAVVDAARPPIDKACGEGILPAGVEALRHLGVALTGSDGCFFRGIRFIDGDISVEAEFRAARGLAVRRTHLHDRLVERARDVGVRLFWGRSAGSTSTIDCQWVVGADGQDSRIRREAGLDDTYSLSTRYGFRRHYSVEPWTDMVEVLWGPRCQVYVTPVAPGEVGVAVLTRDSHLRLDAALQEFPALERRLRSAAVTSPERGSITTSRHLRRVFRGRTVLVGDASGSVDAITGDGLSLSFLQASALSEALAGGDPNIYQAEHRRLGRPPAAMAHALLLLDRFPWLRRVVLRGLAFEPSIFGHLLARHAAGETL